MKEEDEEGQAKDENDLSICFPPQYCCDLDR